MDLQQEQIDTVAQGKRNGTAQVPRAPNQTATNSIAEMQENVAELKSFSRLLLFQGKVLGQKTEFLVDPGATSSFIDTDFADVLGVPQKETSFSVGLAEGGQLKFQSSIPNAPF
ncbi:hypothetical protein CYMTET_37829 [Cymbomonas tetramitiformis]|uniref:Uncharacterized protein n=1 Tax=Cymbomonas tetramitiformis TaxID=36881 RepID=A0AAE0F776_9CHLO|nr:hypothetical protein CYMTET_37829 [Cymbomonas tetramitiformis]